MKNPFKIYEDIIRALDSRVKRLERLVADIRMFINAQIGQAKYVRKQTGGKASQVSIPGGVSAGGGDGKLYAPPTLRGEPYNENTDEVVTTVFTEKKTGLIEPIKAFLSNIFFPKKDASKNQFLCLNSNARVASGPKTTDAEGRLDDVVLPIPKSVLNESECGIPENVNFIKFNEHNLEVENTGKMTLVFVEQDEEKKCFPVAVIA